MNTQDLEDFTGFEGGASTTYSSPGAPAIFDVVASSSNPGTISPQDLLIQDPYMSAPNSTALTALTSPSPFESPEFVDGFNVSPNFSSLEYDNGSNQWFSLFPDQGLSTDNSMPVSDHSPIENHLDVEEVDDRQLERKSSSSPGGGRHSSVSGVGSRKRDKPLPPIVVEDPNDVVAMKRARNTLAARKSRERKAQRFDELEEKIRRLEAERDHWKNIALSRSSN